jgi:hypothetical protein
MKTASDEIHEKAEAFGIALSKIAFAHGRRPFSTEMKDDIWEQCQYIEAEAWEFICDRFRDLDAPPKNTAKAIKAFHYQWLESNPTHMTVSNNDKPEYKAGVIGPRILHHKRNGMGSVAALATACQEYARGELVDALVGKGPVFNTGKRENTGYDEHGGRGEGPQQAGW